MNLSKGVFPNGTRSYAVGPRETFRNCGDIAIKRNTSLVVPYTPNPIEETPVLYSIWPETPIIFTFKYSKLMLDLKKKVKINKLFILNNKIIGAAFGPAPARLF